MSNWNNFNTAEDQHCYCLIPNGTIAKVRMTIKPGGYNDIAQGWTGGYATRSESETVYLNLEFVVLEGEYARRKIWSRIGLYSPKGPEWGNMGRSFIKAILNSARGISPQDTSEKAVAARQITGFADLDGLEFTAKIEIIKDKQIGEKNEIKIAVPHSDKDSTASINKMHSANITPNSNSNRHSWA